MIPGNFRNIPFTVLGALIVVLFYRSAQQTGARPFPFLSLPVVISCGWWVPGGRGAGRIPAVGMLMMPKACAYVWTVLIGFNAMKGRKNQ